mmetsp:Transcript_12489/g.20345  ORF Transcript_12489/g.20345 Transcript_12489/m.20345 type:complete len:263 (+) Transcript_12489:1966-2754(+)
MTIRPLIRIATGFPGAGGFRGASPSNGAGPSEVGGRGRDGCRAEAGAERRAEAGGAREGRRIRDEWGGLMSRGVWWRESPGDVRDSTMPGTSGNLVCWMRRRRSSAVRGRSVMGEDDSSSSNSSSSSSSYSDSYSSSSSSSSSRFSSASRCSICLWRTYMNRATSSTRPPAPTRVPMTGMSRVLRELSPLTVAVPRKSSPPGVRVTWVVRTAEGVGGGVAVITRRRLVGVGSEVPVGGGGGIEGTAHAAVLMVKAKLPSEPE